VLLECTQLTYDDLRWNPSLNGYTDYIMPNVFNQSAAKYCLTESVAHGIDEFGWASVASQVIIPKGSYLGSDIYTPWNGMVAEANQGDAPDLVPFWWFGFMDKTDPLLWPTWDWITYGSTRNYTFNRGQMSVVASKLYDSTEALNWAQDLYHSDVLYDDAAISEMVYDGYDFQRCPEIAAHGALMISTIQMLVDPDNYRIEVFPAIPASWWTDGVSFTNMAVKGAILVDGNVNANSITINLANTNSAPTTRNLRVWLPPGTTELLQSPSGTVVANGYAALRVTIPANSNQDYLFVLSSYCAEFLPGDINKDCYVDMRDFAILAENWLRVAP
jgi:hypothetical protein